MQWACHYHQQAWEEAQCPLPCPVAFPMRSFEAAGALVPVHHRQQSQLTLVFRPATGLTTYTSLD